jgi:hypothetical protein
MSRRDQRRRRPIRMLYMPTDQLIRELGDDDLLQHDRLLRAAGYMRRSTTPCRPLKAGGWSATLSWVCRHASGSKSTCRMQVCFSEIVA